METTGVLYATVAGPDAQGLANATVTVADAQGFPVGTAISGPDGRYQLSGLPPGEYNVVTSLYEPTTHQLELTSGGPTTVDLQLPLTSHRVAELA